MKVMTENEMRNVEGGAIPWWIFQAVASGSASLRLWLEHRWWGKCRTTYWGLAYCPVCKTKR